MDWDEVWIRSLVTAPTHLVPVLLPLEGPGACTHSSTHPNHQRTCVAELAPMRLLRWSPDGAFLLTAPHGQAGFSLWSTRDWSQVRSHRVPLSSHGQHLMWMFQLWACRCAPSLMKRALQGQTLPARHGAVQQWRFMFRHCRGRVDI